MPLPDLMSAMIYEQVSAEPTLQQVPTPNCPVDGVIVEVKATGVCRSDWHAWSGHDPVPLPMVPGHEFCGVVAQVGADVRHWRVGDRVVVPFACGCGNCEYCAAGDSHICPRQTQPGFTHWGSFAEYVAVNAADTNLVALPDGIEYVSAAALGCRFSTAFRGLINRGQLSAGEQLAVFGCGGVGLSAVMVGVAAGADVIAVDLNPRALEKARELGASHVFSAGPEVVSQIRELTAGGVHVAVDALGSIETMNAAIAALRRGGRHVQLGLLLGAAAEPRLPMARLIAEELTIVGGHGMPAGQLPELLAWIAQGRLDPVALVGREIPLSESGRALVEMSAPSVNFGIQVVNLAR